MVAVYAGLFAVSAILFALDITQHDAASATRQTVTDAVAPVLGAISGAVSYGRDWMSEAAVLVSLSSEVGRLRQENEALRSWQQRAVELESRAERYEALLHMRPDDRSDMISARVIADARTPFSRSVIINAGESDSVSQGQAVLGSRGLIGQVISVGVHTSRVLLATDLESRIPVYVGAERHRSILVGTNGAHPSLMHLPPGAAVDDGDVVVTSGEGQAFPPGLVIGTVRRGAAGSVSVVLASDPRSVEFVRIYGHAFSVDVAAGAPPLPSVLAEGEREVDVVPVAAVVVPAEVGETASEAR